MTKGSIEIKRHKILDLFYKVRDEESILASLGNKNNADHSLVAASHISEVGNCHSLVDDLTDDDLIVYSFISYSGTDFFMN